MRGRRLVIAVALVAALAGCAAPAGGGPGPAPAGERTVTLDVRFSRFSPADLDVPVGTVVRFVVRNTDPIAHELIVGGSDVHERHERGTEPHHGEVPGEVSVPAGGTAATTYTFSRPGRVVFGCHLPGHWAYGMRGTVTVG